MNESTNDSSLYLNQEVCDEEKLARVSYIAVVAVFQVITFYAFISLLLSLKRAAPTSADGNCTLRYATILRSLLVAVIFTINAREGLDLIQLGLGARAHDYFGAIFLSKSVLTTIIHSCVYSFLWLRQWILYDQPMLKKVKTKAFTVFNIFVLILVVSLVAAGPVVETRYVQLHLTEDGCMLVRTHKWGFALGVYTAFSILYQLILLGFFIYPLMQTHKHAGAEDATTVTPIVMRSSLSAIACFLDEIVFTILHNVIERPLMLNTISTDLKLIVYYICLVASYNDWKQKFCVLCAPKLNRTNSLSRAPSEYRSKLSSDDMEVKTLRGDRHVSA